MQSEANLPSDRARAYVAELVERGLLEGPPYRVTPKGEAFLREFARYRAFLRDFGLVRGEPAPPPPVEGQPSGSDAEQDLRDVL